MEPCSLSRRAFLQGCGLGIGALGLADVLATSANANEFVTIGERLSPRFRVIAPDLRGRAGSDKPASGYAMADHANDVVRLLDTLGLERVVLGGHSFGGFLSVYIARFHPERVERLVVLDAGMRLHPNVRDMLRPSLDRLQRRFDSEATFLREMQRPAYVGDAWDGAMESYYRADLEADPEGGVRTRTRADAIAHAMEHVLAEPWREIISGVPHPTLLIHASGDYGPPGTGSLLPEDSARETAASFPNGRYVQVPGNHLTMVFGEPAAHVCQAIETFLTTVVA